MASEKDDMLDSANYFIGLVASANQSCRAAASGLASPLSEGQQNWKGESGKAMAQALENLSSSINAVCGQLSALETQMRTRVMNIYDNWPEETEEEA